MKQTLNLKLSQRLIMTPQLKQSLRLLRLSSQDLEQEVQNQLDSNPLLERNETGNTTDDTSSNGEDIAVSTDATKETIIKTAATENGIASATIDSSLVESNEAPYVEGESESLAAEQDLSSNWDEQSSSHQAAYDNQQYNGNSNAVEFTQFVSKQETLFEHLNWQIQMTTLTNRDKSIASSILHSLDEEGYLTIALDEIKQMFDPELEIEEDEINAVLSLIKTLEPIGAGARDLQDRLQIFLTRMPEETAGLNVAKRIVSEHLDLVASHNLSKLKKQLGIDEQLLSTSLNLITTLNPRITTNFKSDDLSYVIPDILVKQNNQSWQAFINPDNQSKLRINQLYADMLKSKIDDSESEYIQSNLLQAKMFIKGIMSRYDTLLLVSQTIVERQQDFFREGEDSMQPMVLQDIADELDMHESTISRATSGKYLLCNRGVYELKFFFSSALTATDGSTSSSIAIRSLIKKMVDHELKNKPLSDNKIAQMLEEQGHIVARRTVAKYRESMQIAPSSQRKSLI